MKSKLFHVAEPWEEMIHLPGKIRPEDALLIWCAQKCPEEERSEQIRRLIREGINGSYLIETS